jgi:hypothetical protein
LKCAKEYIKEIKRTIFTTVVHQKEGAVKFNVAANRIFRYGGDPDVLAQAIESIVTAIETGLLEVVFIA